MMKRNLGLLVLFVFLTALAVWLYFNSSSHTIKPELRDFAVADTASIDKMFLADRKGNTVLLERNEDNTWTVNKKFTARSSGINTLLYTIKALEVRSPVGKNLFNNTMKLMASNAVKIEIYQKGKLVKTYYVGHPTMDTQGTFMYLDGSSVPFIMHIPGFTGYLSTRYYATESDWKEHSLLRFDPKRVVDVKIENFSSPHRSFELRRNADSSYVLTTLKNNKIISPLDPVKLRTFLGTLGSTNYEREDVHINARQHDSLIVVGPFATVNISDDSGKKVEMKLYRSPINDASKNPINLETGKPYSYDMDKLSVQMSEDTSWYMCQYFHFDRLLKDPLNFQPGPDKSAPQKRD